MLVVVNKVEFEAVEVGGEHGLHEAKNVAEVVWHTKKGTWASAQR